MGSVAETEIRASNEKCERRGTATKRSDRNGTPATANADASRQINGSRIHAKHDQTKRLKAIDMRF